MDKKNQNKLIGLVAIIAILIAIFIPNILNNIIFAIQYMAYIAWPLIAPWYVIAKSYDRRTNY